MIPYTPNVAVVQNSTPVQMAVMAQEMAKAETAEMGRKRKRGRKNRR